MVQTLGEEEMEGVERKAQRNVEGSERMGRCCDLKTVDRKREYERRSEVLRVARESSPQDVTMLKLEQIRM